MKWNNEEGYVIYNQSLQNLKSIFNIGQIDYILRCETAPYITYILKYLSKRLILLGEDMDIKTYIQEIFDIFAWGSDKILSDAVEDLRIELGIDNGEIYVEDSEIPYNSDRLIFTWSNVLTALVVRLKFQYSSLLEQPADTDCPCDECGNTKGQTVSDFESWQSGVFPEDEEYSWYNLRETTWRVNNDVPECTKCSRRF